MKIRALLAAVLVIASASGCSSGDEPDDGTVGSDGGRAADARVFADAGPSSDAVASAADATGAADAAEDHDAVAADAGAADANAADASVFADAGPGDEGASDASPAGNDDASDAGTASTDANPGDAGAPDAVANDASPDASVDSGADCPPDWYGPLCDQHCPSTCAPHGSCNDGRNGDGFCLCDTGFDPALACGDCVDGRYGALCAQTCAISCGAHGACRDGLGGDGTCACAPGYAGAACATCSLGYQSDGMGGCALIPVVAYDAYGTGVAGDPYLIFTAAQLDDIGKSACGETPGSIECGAHFMQMADIDLGGFTGTTFHPIGDCNADDNLECFDAGDTPFVGSFDGNGFTIRNLTWHGTTEDGVALVALLGPGGLLHRVRVTNADVSGDRYVAGLAAFSAGDIVECHADGAARPQTYGGMLVGQQQGGTIARSSAGGSVVGGQVSGGLVGFLRGGEVDDSYSRVDVTNGGLTVGGLIGWVFEAAVRRSYASGRVDSVGSNTGGLFGVVSAGFPNPVPPQLSACWRAGYTQGFSNFDHYVGVISGYDSGQATYSAVYYDASATFRNGGNGTTNTVPATGIDTSANAGYFHSLLNAPMTSWNTPDVVWCEVSGDSPRLCWEGP